jgi:hypothetical protein
LQEGRKLLISRECESKAKKKRERKKKGKNGEKTRKKVIVRRLKRQLWPFYSPPTQMLDCGGYKLQPFSFF